MDQYRNTTRVPLDLASGRLVTAGGDAALPTESDRDPHDQEHIDRGRLVALHTPPVAADQPEAIYADVLAGGIPDVNAYLADHPDEVEVVLAAEKAGQNRKGITNADRKE